jgi:translation initiation factor IF-3
MVVDKGKFLFDVKKKEKEKAKLVQSTKVKEITVKPRIGDNDLARFAKNTIDWLQEGCQVKFKIKAPGRMAALSDLIQQVYEKYVGLVGDKAKIQQPLKKLSPILYSAFLVPNKK